MSSLALTMVSLVVPDYDEAIDYFVGKVGFRLRSDTAVSETKRWVELESDGGMRLLLAKAANERQLQAIGNQTGGRVGFFLYTDDFDLRYRGMAEAGVVFCENPRTEPYGKVIVFEDYLGNRWDLIESANR